ncbi:MAG: PelD GGDEF domain-containing protein [Rhodocyclales bacterium]|nr:PelD GGDEF domain-containing protein [Rhodocyclales bacterium]
MKRKLYRYLLPFGNPWAVAGEAVMLPLFAVGIGIWVNPLDPLWTQAGFPWIWFAPVILAMRYGPFPGLTGAAVLLFAWIAFRASGWVPAEFPKLNFLGGLILVMLAGEFSSLWLARARRAEGIQLYLDQRLEYLTHQYYLLRLSHDRLEQDLIGRPMAMRDALAALHDLAREADDNGDSLPGAAGLLRLFAQYCQVEAAALYATAGDGFAPTPVAAMGRLADDGRLAAADPLLAHARENGCLSHIATAQEPGDQPSRYVIVAPLTTFDGRTLGLLAVERVPFFALHEEMLQTLNLLLGYYTDGLSARRLASQVQAAFPTCPTEFAAELQRLWRVREESQVRSVIVALEFQARPDYQDLASQIRRQRRALDVNWLIESPQQEILVTLMPLAGSAAAEGYIARIEEWIRQKTGHPLDEVGVFAHVLRVEDEAPVPLLNRLLKICNVPAEA